MGDKSELCTGCGRFRPDGAFVDVGDGDGVLWTCPDCENRLRALHGTERKTFIVWEQVVEHSTYKYVIEAESAEEARRQVVDGERDDGTQNDSHITEVLSVEVEEA